MKIDQQLIIHSFKDGLKQSEIVRLTGASKGYIHIVLRNNGLIPFPKSHLKEDTLNKIKESYELGKSIREIGEELNITRYEITIALKKKFRKQGDSNHIRRIRSAPEIDKSVKQVILGSLLGDASISHNNNRGYHVRITHSKKQSGYAEHLALKLGVKLHEYDGKPNKLIKKPFKYLVLWYKNARFSKFLESIVLINGKKRVNEKWINELDLESIAYWFLDDGSSTWTRYSVCIHFSTLGFDKEENELLANKLTSMGYLTKIGKDNRKKPGLFLNMSRTVTNKFMQDIKSYVWPIESMRYKIKIME